MKTCYEIKMLNFLEKKISKFQIKKDRFIFSVTIQLIYWKYKNKIPVKCLAINQHNTLLFASKIIIRSNVFSFVSIIGENCYLKNKTMIISVWWTLINIIVDDDNNHMRTNKTKQKPIGKIDSNYMVNFNNKIWTFFFARPDHIWDRNYCRLDFSFHH